VVARNKKYIEDQPVCENDSTIIYSLLSCIISQALCEMRSFTHNQEFLRKVARHKWEEGYRGQQDIGHEGFDDRGESCCNSVNRGESVLKKRVERDQMTYMRPTATSNTLSRSAKFRNPVHALRILRLIVALVCRSASCASADSHALGLSADIPGCALLFVVQVPGAVARSRLGDEIPS